MSKYAELFLKSASAIAFDEVTALAEIAHSEKPPGSAPWSDKKLVPVFISAAALALTVLLALQTGSAPDARHRLEVCAMSKGALCDLADGASNPAATFPVAVADLGAMQVIARPIA